MSDAFGQRIARMMRMDWRLIVWTSCLSFGFFGALVVLQSIGFDVSPLRLVGRYSVMFGVLGITFGFFLFVAERLGLITRPANRGIIDDAIEKRLYEIEEKIILLSNTASNMTDLLLRNDNGIVETRLLPELKIIAENYFSTQIIKSIETKLISKHADGIDISTKMLAIKSVFMSSIGELNEQIVQQRQNANVNLLIGLLFSFIGAFFLSYVFYETYVSGSLSLNMAEIKPFILGFIPRLTFVLLVESLAFFFLSLYREDRNMIRYFRNEITNFEARFIALETSFRFGDKETLDKVIAVFAATERNFTIKKGEKLIFDSLREEEERLFSRFIDKISNNFDLSKIRNG